MPAQPESPTSWRRPEIDPAKRYDVYVSEPSGRIVLYRNALFKAALHLVGTDTADRAPRFLELEQSNGQSVYIPRVAVVKLCEHGVELTHEVVHGKDPTVR